MPPDPPSFAARPSREANSALGRERSALYSLAVDELGAHDWERLAEMRADFLDAATGGEHAALADYWTSRRDLEL